MKEVVRKWHLITVFFILTLIIAIFPEHTRAEEKLNGKIYDVTAYGADNKGISQSDAGVSQAVAAARTDIIKGNLDGKDKAIIYFPSGTYKLSGSIQLRRGMAVAAEANTTVVGYGDRLLRLNSADKAVIQGGTWKLSKGTAAITSNKCKDIIIKNLKVSGGESGIKLYATTGKMENVTVYDAKNVGVAVAMESDITAVNCNFYKNGYSYPKTGHGIGVYTRAKLTISNSQLNSNRASGLSVNNGTAVINNCTLQKNGTHGVGTTVTANITMKNCDIYKNGLIEKEAGVSFLNQSTGKVINCKFRSNAGTGLQVNYGGTKVTVSGCVFKGNKSHNIHCQNTWSGKVYLKINSCSFYKTPLDSILITANGKSNFSLSMTGKNKFYNTKYKYTYFDYSKTKYTYKK